MKQTTDMLLMIRPSRFGFNPETAATNFFQQEIDAIDIHERALKEFDAFVKLLREHKIYVIVFQDPGFPHTPDSLFPNNWISFHEHTMILYPMLAENRRPERRKNWISLLKKELGIREVIDLSTHESEHKFLEGTGSLVVDRINKVAYANLSSRTDRELAVKFSAALNCELVCFTAADLSGREIYHTNVIMAIGQETAVICSEVIKDEKERNAVLKKLQLHHEVVQISFNQLTNFAGNMLQVKNRDGEKFWVMSDRARRSLASSQLAILEKDGRCISSPLETIEAIGGGSARCMLCEII